MYKTALVTLATTAVTFASARPAAAGPPFQSTYTVSIEAEVDQAIASLQERIRSTNLQARDFSWVGDAIGRWARSIKPDFPNACNLRKNLNRKVGDLAGRATSAFVRMEHLAELQEQVIDSRLDRAIQHLLDQVAKRGGTRELYYKIVRMLHERADVVEHPDADEMRARLVASLDELYQRGFDSVQALKEWRVFFIQAKLYRAKALLAKHASRMELTRYDYAQVRYLWNQRARAVAGENPFPPCK